MPLADGMGNQVPFGDNLTRLQLFPNGIKCGLYRPRYKIRDRFCGNFIAVDGNQKIPDSITRILRDADFERMKRAVAGIIEVIHYANVKLVRSSGGRADLCLASRKMISRA